MDLNHFSFFPEGSVLTKCIPLLKGWKSRGESTARKIERSQCKSDGISEPAPECETGAEADPQGTRGAGWGWDPCKRFRLGKLGGFCPLVDPHELFQWSGEVRKTQGRGWNWNCAPGHRDLIFCPHCAQHSHWTQILLNFKIPDQQNCLWHTFMFIPPFSYI